MPLDERFIASVVRQFVMGGQALERGARAVADARRKGLHALGEAGIDIRLMQQHPGQPQHDIQLPANVDGDRVHRRQQSTGGDCSFKVA